jgi:putative membrane protein
MTAKWILLALVFALPAASFAKSNNVSQQDKTWMKKAHQVNLAEFKAGKAARKNAKSAIVRGTGHTLTSDHEMLDASLKRAAEHLGVSLPEGKS